MKQTLQIPAAKGRKKSDPDTGEVAPSVQNPQRERLDDVMKALKLNLMTTGITLDDRDRAGSDPYNSRPESASKDMAGKDIWNGSRRRR